VEEVRVPALPVRMPALDAQPRQRDDLALAGPAARRGRCPARAAGYTRHETVKQKSSEMLYVLLYIGLILSILKVSRKHRQGKVRMSATRTEHTPDIIRIAELEGITSKFDVKVVESADGDLYAVVDEDWDHAIKVTPANRVAGLFAAIQTYGPDEELAVHGLDVDDDSLHLIAESGQTDDEIWTYPHRAKRAGLVFLGLESV
jgi:hypothetical protein